MEATLDNGLLILSFRYDPGVLEWVRSLPGRRWDPERKIWTVPASKPTAREVLSFAGEAGCSEDVIELADVRRERTAEDEARDRRALHHGMSMWQPGWTTPHEHQLRGLGELLLGQRWLLAWEMGTGKSAVAAMALRTIFDKPRPLKESLALIVCPRSVLRTWPDELEKHAGLGCVVYDGAPTARARIRSLLYNEQIVVTTYELLRQDREHLRKLSIRAVVADECHRAKTMTTKSSRALRAVSRRADWRWALSGTPAPNAPTDIWGTLTYLDEALLGTISVTALRRRYCVMGRHPGQVVGYRNLDELSEITARVSSRVTKEQALDLPDKVVAPRTCQLSGETARVYRDVRDKAVARLKEGGTLTVDNVIAESLRLLQIAGGHCPTDDGGLQEIPSPKLDLLADVLADVPVDEPIIVWTAFVAEAERIAKMLDDGSRSLALHHGRLSNEARTEAVEGWKRGETDVLVTTAASLREGVTLTRAAISIYYSRSYSLLDWLQSSDRSHRIGQDRKVTIIPLVAAGTIDEKVEAALDRKEKVQEMILKGADVEALC